MNSDPNHINVKTIIGSKGVWCGQAKKLAETIQGFPYSTIESITLDFAEMEIITFAFLSQLKKILTEQALNIKVRLSNTIDKQRWAALEKYNFTQLEHWHHYFSLPYPSNIL